MCVRNIGMKLLEELCNSLDLELAMSQQHDRAFYKGRVSLKKRWAAAHHSAKSYIHKLWNKYRIMVLNKMNCKDIEYLNIYST